MRAYSKKVELKMQSDPQRVFMIGWEYPPHNSGGLGVACAGMTKALAGKHTDIHFALPYHHDEMVSHMHVLDCSDPSWFSSDPTLRFQPPLGVYETGTLIATTPDGNTDTERMRLLPQSEIERKVAEYADQVVQKGSAIKQQFDVIHAHDWMSLPAAADLRQKTGKPMIAHIHSTEFDRAALQTGNQMITQIEKAGMEAADQIIAVSYYTKRLLTDRYGIAANKISVVHNGIDPIAFAPPIVPAFAPKRPVVAYMGRLTVQKGIEYFLSVARKVVEKVPNALFVVAGSGDMYHELLFRSAYDQLSALVLFSGFLRDSQRERLLERADVFMMPSISEPFGLVALEAAQRHTPVIVSKNAGVGEVLPGAVAVDFWDVDVMAATVTQLLTSSSAHAKQVSAQLADVQKLTWGKAADQISSVYRKAFLGK